MNSSSSTNSKWQLTLTLLTHKTGGNLPVGFNPQSQSLIININYNDNLLTTIDKLNQWRMPEQQITVLYNQLGQVIPKPLWKNIKLQEHLKLYVDTI